MKRVTCIKCGLVSFAVTRAYAEAEVASFNVYFNSLTTDEQQNFYGGKGASIQSYKCMLCGGSLFRPSLPGDCPDGCTLNPVICDELADKCK